MSTFLRFFRDESGATAIEYGLIAAGISVAPYYRGVGRFELGCHLYQGRYGSQGELMPSASTRASAKV